MNSACTSFKLLIMYIMYAGVISYVGLPVGFSWIANQILDRHFKDPQGVKVEICGEG